MAKRRGRSRGVLIIALILLAVIIGGIVSNATNGFQESLKNFAVIYKEEYILNNKNELFIKEGDRFEIKQYSGAKEEISVKILALESKKENQIYTFSGRSFEWNETLAGKDVTACFQLEVIQPTENQNGEVNISGNLMDVLEYFSEGAEVELGEDFTIAQDLFCMVLTVGSDVMTLGFSVQMSAISISLDSAAIVF